MDETTANPIISPFDTILGYKAVSVVLKSGPVAQIQVRQMPARFLITKYLSVCEDEAALLDAVCRLPAELPASWPKDWIDDLTDDSHALLVETAHELNFSRAERQAKRGIKLRQRLQPLEVLATSSASSSTPPPSS